MWFTNIIYTGIGYMTYFYSNAIGTGCENKLDNWVSGRVKRNVTTSLKFNVCNYSIHIHHWLYLFIIGIVTSFTSLKYFCLGGMIQGLFSYDDWWQIIKKIP
jgi:hypothetical protein